MANPVARMAYTVTAISSQGVRVRGRDSTRRGLSATAAAIGEGRSSSGTVAAPGWRVKSANGLIACSGNGRTFGRGGGSIRGCVPARGPEMTSGVGRVGGGAGGISAFPAKDGMMLSPSSEPSAKMLSADSIFCCWAVASRSAYGFGGAVTGGSADAGAVATCRQWGHRTVRPAKFGPTAIFFPHAGQENINADIPPRANRSVGRVSTRGGRSMAPRDLFDQLLDLLADPIAHFIPLMRWSWNRGSFHTSLRWPREV